MGLLKALGAQGCTKLQEMSLIDMVLPHLNVPLYVKSKKKTHTATQLVPKACFKINHRMVWVWLLKIV